MEFPQLLMTLFPCEMTQQGRYGPSSQDSHILGLAWPWTLSEASTLLSLEPARLLTKTEQRIYGPFSHEYISNSGGSNLVALHRKRRSCVTLFNQANINYKQGLTCCCGESKTSKSVQSSGRRAWKALVVFQRRRELSLERQKQPPGNGKQGKEFGLGGVAREEPLRERHEADARPGTCEGRVGSRPSGSRAVTRKARRREREQRTRAPRGTRLCQEGGRRPRRSPDRRRRRRERGRFKGKVASGAAKY